MNKRLVVLSLLALGATGVASPTRTVADAALQQTPATERMQSAEPLSRELYGLYLEAFSVGRLLVAAGASPERATVTVAQLKDGAKRFEAEPIEVRMVIATGVGDGSVRVLPRPASEVAAALAHLGTGLASE